MKPIRAVRVVAAGAHNAGFGMDFRAQRWGVANRNRVHMVNGTGGGDDED